MSLKSASTVVEVPGVITAVEHLQELGIRMKRDEFGFNAHDVSTIDRIIEAINELQKEGEKIHEKLETETIKASVLRHTLQFLPGQIKSEVNGAISAARQSNAEELTRLQDSLNDINNNIKSQQERHAFLEKENAVLHPERDRVRDEHEDIIAQLNQRMAEKASKQIILNETRDELRETNQKIVDLDEGILQLKDDLVQERADARMEKKRLKKSVYDTTMKTREQKEINVVKKKELDELQERVFESESKLDEIRKSIRRYETSRTRLEGQERALTSQLKKETNTNESLREKGIALVESLEEQELSYQSLKSDLDGQNKGLKKEIKSGEKNKKEQTTKKSTLKTVVADKMHSRQLDEGRVKEQNNLLQEAKQDLAWKAEDAARLRQENMDMENRIKELGETHDEFRSMGTASQTMSLALTQSDSNLSYISDTCTIAETPDRAADAQTLTPDSIAVTQQQPHKTFTHHSAAPQHTLRENAPRPSSRHEESFNQELHEAAIAYIVDRERSIVATFQKQIEEMRAQLSKERKERMGLQGQRDTVQKEIDDFKVETRKYMNDMNRKINDGKTKHDELTREGTQLQKMIRQDDENIRRMQMELSRARTSLEDFRTFHEGEIATLEREISEMKVKTKETEEIVVQRTPSFEVLEKHYEQRTDDYDKMKKQIVAMKNKKLGLDDAVKRAGRDIDKLTEPTAKLRIALKTGREEYMQQLKKHSSERSEIERTIYTTGSKLRTAMDENEKFTDQSDQFEAKIKDITQETEHTDQCTRHLAKEVENIKETLAEEWFKDNNLEQEFANRDQALVEELGQLLNRTEKREHVISDITGKLQSELSVLAQFLDNVAKRRPKESASSKAKGQFVPKSGKSSESLTPTQAGVAIESVALVNSGTFEDAERPTTDVLTPGPSLKTGTQGTKTLIST